MNKNVLRGLVAAGVVTVTGAANAAVDAAITTAVTGAQADGVTLVGALAAAGAAVFIIHKLLKRFGISL